MSFLIAAAGTGGHVFPGLAVAEALIDLGVEKGKIAFVGGDRLESSVYPAEGFDFIELELRGLKRSLSASNLTLPRMVYRARDRIVTEIRDRLVGATLAMGGYVTIPTALAARSVRTPLFISEQNAGAGLANRIAARWASRVFVSFPATDGLPSGEWVGNPVRRQISTFDRDRLSARAREYFGLSSDLPTVGVFGGSLGAASINGAVAAMAATWGGPPLQLLHLVGASHVGQFVESASAGTVKWVRRGFEDRMDLFYAAIDLVIARAGGAVAEITATGTPSILIPGDFGSSGHQSSNAAHLESKGAAIVLNQEKLSELPAVLSGCLDDPTQIVAMRKAALGMARPDAAKTIAQGMIDAV
jgi:UDP-N-acetylglucosamine--N-acetylmuramyl-(pentapeptide) pyrophosphoryl-undecaprenol N-acetylglucosamine transferase